MPETVTPPAPLAASVADVVRETVARLRGAGVADPQVDAELLIAHVMDSSRGGVQAAAIRGDRMPESASLALAPLVDRRCAREPLQHLTGRAPFRSMELAVGPGVFVPRPETEMVAQLAIDALRAVVADAPIAVDLGTGSGAIALAMATEVPHARVFAAENSVDAFIWTKQNHALIGADNLTSRSSTSPTPSPSWMERSRSWHPTRPTCPTTPSRAIPRCACSTRPPPSTAGPTAWTPFGC